MLTIKEISLFIIFIAACMLAQAQIKVERNFNLELAEKDSIKSLKLEKSLNAFLTEAQQGKFSNEYVDSTHQRKYEFFFNKLVGFGKNSPGRVFNNPIVIKSYSERDEGEIYFITFSLSGSQDGQPFIYRIVEVKAVPYNDHYRFYSPFEERTSNFKSEEYDNITYYYSGNFNKQKALEFSEIRDELSTLTHTEKSPLDYYKFESIDELLKSYGLIYSANNCNFLCYDLGFTDSEGEIYMTGTDNENYIFGYVGDYLYYNLPNREQIYWPFVNGISTYFGGYGLSYESIEELKAQFRSEIERKPNIDFLEEFKKGRKSSVNRHFSYFVMSAFICEAVIKDKGFENVLKLVYSGKDGGLFFENLKKVLDVDETGFHDFIENLIYS
ncbi:hypothetical protein SAMN05661096_02421 [Marivirga sericea]|uniref:Uncharacterized protein n=1 Tax=Marivirga sericea TaxID=1028 RepID=A0A1X7K655_9BACT|nr:hypothetical protein [Marivirga sericea]SMG36264.1 hypothetical protein SAMN05661096_02421 [Marivirga sericea]